MASARILSSDSSAGHFSVLPDELSQAVFELLDYRSLCRTATVSRWAYHLAVPLIWRSVELVDRRHEQTGDDHNDKPIIERLIVLARDPWIASHVQTLTHRCHLPTPDIFQELPKISFKGETLSRDVRTLKLLHLAIQNMVNVRTLRIIYGHWNLTRGLLYGFFDYRRVKVTPVRRLWLESCSIEGIASDFDQSLWPAGLESVRFRRMRIVEFPRWDGSTFALARSGHLKNFYDGKSGMYQTTVHSQQASQPTDGWPDFQGIAKSFDDGIYQTLQVDDLLEGRSCEAHPVFPQRAVNPFCFMSGIFLHAARTITSLNLDWILTCKTPMVSAFDDRILNPREQLLHMLAGLRLPRLRSFQLRNAVVDHTMLPQDVYLFESEPYCPWMEFMEAHPNLQCLAWPMDRFFSHRRSSTEIAQRARNVIAGLSNTLLELRVDSYYSRDGEPFTDNSSDREAEEMRIRRRRFISEFAAHMTKVEHLKIEGCIPRDEKREIIRAMHRCPLTKIVMIGVSCPIGNFWGHEGVYVIESFMPHHDPDSLDLEGEDESALQTVASAPLVIPEAGWRFTPEYGWPPGPPMLQFIATHHAQTVKELKFCGYSGCLVLYDQTPLQNPLLASLKHFVNLEQLVLSVSLSTWFEGDFRDEEIVSYWLDARDPSRKALAVVPSTEQEEGSWAKFLKERCAPQALANQVAEQLGPLLPEPAKKRGLRIRASFCLGTHKGDIYDLDMRVQTNAAGDKLVVKEFVGPREEGEKGKREAKLENRRWF